VLASHFRDDGRVTIGQRLPQYRVVGQNQGRRTVGNERRGDLLQIVTEDEQRVVGADSARQRDRVK